MGKGKRKMIAVWGIVGGIILIGGGLAAFLALRSVGPQAPPSRPTNVAPANMVSQPTVNEPSVNVPPVNEPLSSAPDRDTDRDGLTDAEELLLGTDAALADTDRDGYDDALELMNLYNPSGIAPQRLLDAGLVYEYKHPTLGWSVYIPRSWTIAAIGQEQQHFQINTGSPGEQIILDAYTNPERFTVEEAAVRFWPTIVRPDPSLVLTSATKRGAELARLTGDVHRALIAIGGDRVIIASHNVRAEPPRYLRLFEMIVQSFAAPAAPVSP